MSFLSRLYLFTDKYNVKNSITKKTQINGTVFACNKNMKAPIFSCFFACFCLLLPSVAWAGIANHVVISQVCFDVPGTENSEEWVELYNPTSSNISLNGWKLVSINGSTAAQTTEWTFGTNDTIPAYGFYLIGATNYFSVFGAPAEDVNMGACDIQNGPDGVLIKNASGDTVDMVGWGSGGTQPYSEGTPTYDNYKVLVRKASENSTSHTLPDTGSESNKGHGWDTNNNSSDFVLFNDYTSCNRHNESSTPEQPPSPSSANISITDIAAGPLRHGLSDSGTVLAGSIDTGPKFIEVIIDKASGSTATGAEIPSLILWRDVNADSAWDGSDVLVGNIPWDATKMCYTMSGSTWDQTSYAPFNFVITASLADTGSLTDGHTFKAELRADSGFLLVIANGTETSWVPGSTLTNANFRTINTELRTEELSTSVASGESIPAGTTNKKMLTVAIPNDAGWATVLKDVSIWPGGTLTSSDYTVKLWHDDGDGSFETGQDTPLYLSWSTDHWETPSDTLNIGISGSAVLHVTASFNNGLAEGKNLTLEFRTSGTAFTYSPNIANNLSSNITSNLFSIMPKLIINEVFPNPSNAYGEFFELYNPSATATINLNGGGTVWYFGDGDNGQELTFPPGATIGPRGYYIVARNANKYRELFPEMPLPNAECDTAGASGGDSLAIADVGLGSVANALALSSDDELYMRISAGSGIEEVVFGNAYDPADVPEGTWTGTAAPEAGAGQSIGRINDGEEGSEPSGANSEDLASAFVIAGKPTPGRPNHYVNIIQPPTLTSGSGYFVIGVYETDGDTLLCSQTLSVRTNDAGCTLAVGPSGVGTVVAGDSSASLTVTTVNGFVRLLITDLASENVTLDVHATDSAAHLCWYDTATISFSAAAQLRITEVATNEGTDYVELYVVDGGAGVVPNGLGVWDGANLCAVSALAGCTTFATGDYIVVWDGSGTNESNGKGANGYWDFYDANISLNGTTEDAAELRDASGTIYDAVYYGPCDSGSSWQQSDIDKIAYGVGNGAWLSEGQDTIVETDQVWMRASAGWSIQRNASNADANSKYDWTVAALTTGAAISTANFQPYAGGGTCDTVYPQYVYPGASVKLRFTHSNDSAAALSGGHLALFAPAGYPSFSTDNLTLSAKDANDSHHVNYVADTIVYANLTGNYTTGPDTIAFCYLVNVPAGTGTDQFSLRSDLWGSAVKAAGYAADRCPVYRVYPDTIDKSQDTAATLWGSSVTLTCTATYQGHPVAGVPVTLVITSKGDVDNTSLSVNGASYATYWTDVVTMTTKFDGTCSFTVNTDPDDTGTNSVCLKFATGAATVGYDTFTVTTDQPSIQINEIMYAPITLGANSGSTYEWIELVNTTAANVDIGNWVLKDEGQADFNFPGGTVVPAYGYLVVSSKTKADLVASDYGYALDDVTVVQMSNMSLNSTSQYLKLLDNNGTERDNLTYDKNTWGGYITGMSTQKKSPSLSGASVSNWDGDTVGTTVRYGTPGHANSNALWGSYISATGATANGSDTAVIVVTLMTPDSNPVPNHAVTVFRQGAGVPAGGVNFTLSSSTGTTDAAGQLTLTATSTEVGRGFLGFAVTAEDSVAVSDTATAWFYTATGFTYNGTDTLISSIADVNTTFSCTQSTAYGAEWALLGLQWSNDGNNLTFVEGDFTTVKGNPGSDRRAYTMDRNGGNRTMISSRAMNPCPYGRLNVADVDGDGTQDAVFSGWCTSYGTPFWSTFYAPVTGVAAAVTNPEAYNLAPQRSNLNNWTPDVTGNSQLNKSGNNLNVAVSENGDIIAYSGAYVKAREYFSRTPDHDGMARLLRGFASGQQEPGSERNPRADRTSYYSYYWYEPTWSPDGTDLALTRVDFREYMDGDGDRRVFQSEIWVLKDANNFVATLGEAWGSHMVRVSPQTIYDTLPAANDGQAGNTADGSLDRFYMNPQWSRDGKVISYAYDRTGNFDLNNFLSNPNAELADCNFDVAMRYIGSMEAGTDMEADGAGSYAITWPEQTILAGDANEFYLSWAPTGAAQIASLYWNGANTEVRTFDLQNEAYITENGGVLFDNGVVTAIVGAGDELASGTVIRVGSANLTNPGTAYDTMAATGVAREFWPSGWQSDTPIIVILHYDAADLAAAGITDGSAAELSLKVFWWDADNSVWVDYEGVVDPDNNTITFFTTHFSTYALFRVLEPSPATSTLSVDRTLAYSDLIDGVAVTATLRDDTGNPVPNVRVTFATDRGDPVEYLSASLSDANGKVTALVKSDRPGTAVISCANLPHVLTETFTVEFLEPPANAGLISNPAIPGVWLYVPVGVFDTYAGFSILFPATGDSFSLYNRATVRAQSEKPAVAFVDNLLVSNAAAEFHAKRLSDGASLDRSFLRPVRVIFAIPAGLTHEQRAGLNIYLLDELDEDSDGLTDEWLSLPTTIDDAANQVWAQVPHFSIYRLGISTVAVSGMNDIVVYPNPWRSDRHANNANYGVKFLLPVNRTFTIKIYNLAGELVDAAEVNTTAAAASYSYRWDLTNAHGRTVASGVYLAVIRDTASGETTVRKIAIVR